MNRIFRKRDLIHAKSGDFTSLDKYVLKNRFGSRMFYEKVNEQNFPRLLDSVKRVSEFLCIEPPATYVNFWPEFFALSLKESRIIIISEDLLSVLDTAELDALVAHEIAHLKQRHSIFLRQRRNFEADRCSIDVAGPRAYFSLFQKIDRLKISSELPEGSAVAVQALVDTNPDCFYEKKQSILSKLTAEHPGRVKRLNAAANYWEEKIVQDQEIMEKAKKLRALPMALSGLLTLGL